MQCVKFSILFLFALFALLNETNSSKGNSVIRKFKKLDSQKQPLLNKGEEVKSSSFKKDPITKEKETILEFENKSKKLDKIDKSKLTEIHATKNPGIADGLFEIFGTVSDDDPNHICRKTNHFLVMLCAFADVELFPHDGSATGVECRTYNIQRLNPKLNGKEALVANCILKDKPGGKYRRDFLLFSTKLEDFYYIARKRSKGNVYVINGVIKITYKERYVNPKPRTGLMRA